MNTSKEAVGHKQKPAQLVTNKSISICEASLVKSQKGLNMSFSI